MSDTFWVQQKKEWENWRELCALLETQGLVTQSDLNTPVGSPAITSGLVLIEKIKAWGESLAALRVIYEKEKGESLAGNKNA